MIPSMMSVEVSLLGSFNIMCEGKPLHIRSRRGRGLLALILISKGRSVPRDRAAALLWPDRSEAQSRASLRQELTTLRRALGPASGIIQSDKEQIALAPNSRVVVDVWALEDRRGELIPSGSFLEGLDFRSGPFEDWRLETGRALDALRIDLAEARIVAAEASGNPKELKDAARSLTDLDRLSETALRAEMRALAMEGREPEAVARFDAFAQRLKHELDTHPGSELARLRADLAAIGPRSFSGTAEMLKRPAILLLPVDVLTGDANDVLLARGLVDDLRTTLAYWRWFPVIGPEAVDPKADGNLRAQAATVEATYVLSLSLRRAGTKVRLTAALVQAADGRSLWSEAFDGTLEDVFRFQEETSHAVVARLEPEIGRAEAERVVRARPTDPRAWQLVAQAVEIERGGGPGYGTVASNHAQLPLLEEAVRRERDYARAWSRMASVNFRLSVIGPRSERQDRLARVAETTREALDLDPTDWEAHAVRGMWATLGERDHVTGVFHGREAANLNPSAPLAQHAAACVLGWAGELEEAIERLHMIPRLNPRYPARAVVLVDTALNQFLLEDAEASLAAASQMVAIAPRFVRGLQRCVAVFGGLGEPELAADALAKLHLLQPEFSLAVARDSYPFARAAHLERFVDGLRRAGVPAT